MLTKKAVVLVDNLIPFQIHQKPVHVKHDPAGW